MTHTDDGIDTDVQALAASTCLALAELLDQQTDTVWNTDSLCEGWRVREVVAHITMPSRYTPDESSPSCRRTGSTSAVCPTPSPRAMPTCRPPRSSAICGPTSCTTGSRPEAGAAAP